MRPIVVSIAGSDGSGGAGIQGDLKAIEAAGGYAATVVTAITVQTTAGVERVEPLPAELVRAQLEALLDDLPVAALKSGMLATAETVAALGAVLARCRGLPYVLDPVLRATRGAALLDEAAIETLCRDLVPRATLLTPNAGEAARLTGIAAVRDLAGAERAGRRLVERGAAAVLVTGGHLEDRPGTDLLVRAGGATPFEGEWIPSAHTHGAGCTLASAIAAGLARGVALERAIASAKRLVEEAIRHGLALGRGRGPTDPLFRLHGAPLATGTRE